MLKEELLRDATTIMPVVETVSEDDKKHIKQDNTLHIAIIEFDGERLSETEPKFVPVPGMKRSRYTTSDDHDDDIAVPTDLIAEGTISIDEAVLSTTQGMVCVPRLASIKCEIIQLPQTEVIPTGANKAAATHPMAGSCDDTSMQFDVWVCQAHLSLERSMC